MERKAGQDGRFQRRSLLQRRRHSREKGTGKKCLTFLLFARPSRNHVLFPMQKSQWGAAAGKYAGAGRKKEGPRKKKLVAEIKRSRIRKGEVLSSNKKGEPST